MLSGYTIFLATQEMAKMGAANAARARQGVTKGLAKRRPRDADSDEGWVQQTPPARGRERHSPCAPFPRLPSAEPRTPLNAAALVVAGGALLGRAGFGFAA